MFSRTNHMIGYKTILSKLKKIEIKPNIFSDHNVMKLKFNNRRKAEECTNAEAKQQSHKRSMS